MKWLLATIRAVVLILLVLFGMGGAYTVAPARAAQAMPLIRGASVVDGSVFAVSADSVSKESAPHCRMSCGHSASTLCCCCAPSGKAGVAGDDCGCAMQKSDHPLAAGDAPRLAGRAALVPSIPLFPHPLLRPVSAQMKRSPNARLSKVVLSVPGPPPRLPFS